MPQQRELRKRKAVPKDDYPHKAKVIPIMDYERVARVYANLWSWCQYIYYSANESQASCHIYPTRRILASMFPYKIDVQPFPSPAADIIIAQLSPRDLNQLVRQHIETILRNGVSLFDELLALTMCLNLALKKSVKKLTSIEALVDLILENRSTAKMMNIYDNRNEPDYRDAFIETLDRLAGASNSPNLTLLKAALYQVLLDATHHKTYPRVGLDIYRVINTYTLDETSFLMIIDIAHALSLSMNTNFIPPALRQSTKIYAKFANYNILTYIDGFRLPEELLQNRPFMLQILHDNPSYYERLPLTMKTELDIVTTVLSKNVNFIFNMPPEIQRNPNVLRSAVSKNGHTLSVGSPFQRNDPMLIRLALGTYVDVLQYVEFSTLYDRDLLMYAISREPHIAIKYVPNDIEQPEFYVAAAFKAVQGQERQNELKRNISATLLSRAIANFEALRSV